jgi:branched-chain amino acid transport system permease protein
MHQTLSLSIEIMLNGLVLAGVFLIVSIGLNIVYGLGRVMNLAHGSLYALGAYFGYLMISCGVNFWLALIFAPLLVTIVSLIIERVVIAPMRNRSVVYTLIVTYGLMFVLDGLVKFFWGNETLFIHLPKFLDQTFYFAGVYYPVYRLSVLFFVVIVMILLIIFLEKTKFGMSMRAASHIPEMVRCLGINITIIHVGAFLLGCFLAGVAGAISAPLYTVYPLMGDNMLINSFVVIVIGGLGSLRGAAVASILIGFVQTLAEFFVPEVAMVIIYMLMAVILSFMPRGVLGEGRLE